MHGLRDYRGKATLLVFYLGYGCLHCAEQLQALAPQARQFEEAGISLVAISTDDLDDLDDPAGPRIITWQLERKHAKPVGGRRGVNKKAKKRLEVINKKLQTLRPRLSGSRAQADDAEELKHLEPMLDPKVETDPSVRQEVWRVLSTSLLPKADRPVAGLPYGDHGGYDLQL